MQEPLDTNAVGPPKLFGKGPQPARKEIARKKLSKVRLFVNEVIELAQHDDVGLGEVFVERAQAAEIDKTAVEIGGKRDGIALDVVAEVCDRCLPVA